MRLHGMTVTLYERTPGGVDEIGEPVTDEFPVEVHNVLVAPIGTGVGKEVTDGMNLDGKQADYILGIPKGDAHEWEDRKVSFFGRDYYTVGACVQGIDDLIPLQWHKKIAVRWVGNGNV